MRLIAIIFLSLVILIKFDVIQVSLLGQTEIRYLFIFAFGLVGYAFISPYMYLFLSNRTEVDRTWLQQHIPEMETHQVTTYIGELPFKPNLFASGSGHRKVIAIDRRIEQALSIEELKFFILHEYSHIKDHDILKLSLMRSVVVAFIPIIALLVSRTIHFNNVLLLLIFVVIVLSLYISGFFLFFHYARLKELKCDRFAAQFTSKTAQRQALENFIALGIMEDTKVKLMSTHPSLQQRLNHLNI